MRILAVTNMLPSPATPRAGTFIEQQIQGLRDVGVKVEVTLVDRAQFGVRAYVGTRDAVRDGIKAAQPDIVHTMYGGVMADLATRECGEVPAVVSFCGVDLLGAGYGSLSYRFRTWVGVKASNRAARRADAIVVKSRNLEQGLPRGIDHRFVWIIPNGVSLERFRPMDRRACQAELGWRNDAFHILFSTTDRSDAKKRLSLAEAAVDRLIGKGLKVEIHGFRNLPHEKVPVWLNAADVTLMTSRSDEGSPNIIKEALACNRPVVSVDVGDVRERIEGISGCFLADATPEDLAAKLVRVFDGPREVASRGRMEGLSLEGVARRLVELYESVIERWNGRR